MAVTLEREPGAVVFSRNPVVFSFRTDARYANAGRPYIGELTFSAVRVDGDTMEVEYGDNKFDFVFKTGPDDSGLQLPAGIEGDDLETWLAAVLAALKKNYYINRDFTVVIGGGKLQFTATGNDPQYDLNVEGTGVSISQLQSGVAPVLNPNLKILAELFVGKTDGLGFESYCTVALEPDDNGDAVWDVSDALTTALLADGHDRPSLSAPVFETSSRTVRPFYLRFAEMYGTPQRVRQTSDTGTKQGVYGGFSKGLLAERSFPGWFMVGTKLKWMDQSNNYKIVQPEQPDYLYTVNFVANRSNVDVRVKVFFSDNTEATYTAYQFAAISRYRRIIVPSGMKQLGVHLQDDEKVPAGYDVWLESAGVSLSEVMRFSINYRYEPYTRFFVFENSFGSYEGKYVYGRKSKGYKIVQESAVITRVADFRLEDGESVDYDIHLTDSEKVNTGYGTRRQMRGFRDFFLSTEKYAFKNGRYYPITLVSRDINEFSDGNNLFALEFEVGSRYSDELFTADEETDEYAYTPDLSGYIPPPPLDPENFDDRYYLKTQTYNKAEINGMIGGLQTDLNTLSNQLSTSVANLLLQIQGKAPMNHTHPQYVTEGFVYDVLDTMWVFRGDWVQIDEEDPEEDGYDAGNYVVYKNALWKSTEDLNYTEPGAPGAKWILRVGCVVVIDNSLAADITSAQLDAAFPFLKNADIIYSESAQTVWTKLDQGKWNITGLNIA
ncbi:hypothetical protein [Parapedobacter lycopersici]|uniref:hypothetical protein n=1 Tax=Parapedobacter lycopersici TaxID=1864939 RepID=UPI003341E76D